MPFKKNSRHLAQKKNVKTEWTLDGGKRHGLVATYNFPEPEDL